MTMMMMMIPRQDSITLTLSHGCPVALINMLCVNCRSVGGLAVGVIKLVTY